MLSCDLESKLIVVETFSKAVHTVMAIQAGRSVGKHMGRHEGCVHLTMTAGTHRGIELGDVVSVAVLAGERFTRLRELVTV